MAAKGLAVRASAGNAGMTVCSWEGCEHPAVGEAHAQWTVVDFIEYPGCMNHLDEMRQVLAERLVDGELPVDVWLTWWTT